MSQAGRKAFDRLYNEICCSIRVVAGLPLFTRRVKGSAVLSTSSKKAKAVSREEERTYAERRRRVEGSGRRGQTQSSVEINDQPGQQWVDFVAWCF